MGKEWQRAAVCPLLWRFAYVYIHVCVCVYMCMLIGHRRQEGNYLGKEGENLRVERTDRAALQGAKCSQDTMADVHEQVSIKHVIVFTEINEVKVNDYEFN